MKNLLFVCSQNKLRSPTAEAVFSDKPNIDVRSAGVNNDAEIPISVEDIEWADYIFVMEQTHKSKVKKRFKQQLTSQKVVCLGIPDNYEYMDPELIKILEKSVGQFIYD
ncbi:low molecular weight protein tyrosine phosphatase family protein [Glaciecola sp. KUL10]|uniref:low molecular weight protein tyrosine phosphatase family protein n=1 Tax=Glaciecola sp. (strain KUL10) TaxID=2161813 RepID=UPI000D787F70|nr:low molecular weight protein tyrosine phosphatase family protein [Glaciecola sp. KUL10]GBL06333.1 hypothetical protein KUL10_36760 [Glaciecola sp. KUL10]